MLVPAVSVAPLAVVVLAWDEATPAVRTLLEAVQAASSPIDSILMMVPQAEAPEALSVEEYLPLSTTTVAELAAQLAEPVPSTPPAPQTTALPAPATLPSELALIDLPEAAAPSELAPVALASDPLALPPTQLMGESSALSNLAWAAVRVVPLSSFSLSELAQLAGQPLPALTWTASLELPAAPYIGASAPTSRSAAGQLATAVPSASAAQLVSKPAEVSRPALLLVNEPANFAHKVDADLLPPEADELSSVELTTSHLLPIDNPLLTGKLDPAATSATPESTPEQAGWPEALAALRQAAPLAEPTLLALTAAQDEVSGLTQALRAAGRSYSAPDLNFQIIQYARFAVPVALADESFAAIYAPAWPTWLAAQELRQRTGRPLVLHVTALAAPVSEPLDIATGWQAELQRQALRCADLVLTETTSLAHRLRHELALPAAAVRIIAAADVEAIAQALRTVQPRTKTGLG